MPQVFISYAREDIYEARRLFLDLQAIDGIDPWLDEESLLPGMNWEDEILAAITSSQFVIVLLSSSSIEKTGFVQKELRNAIEKLDYLPPGEVFIIPARIESCEPRFRALQRLQYVDLFPDWENGISKIYATLKSRVAARLSRILKDLPEPWAKPDEIKTWLEKHGVDIRTIDPAAVIEFLDKRHEIYNEELRDLDTILCLVRIPASQSALLYLRRVHELIAKTSGYPNEFFYANGLLLEAAKLLHPSLRTMLLRDIFAWYIERINSIIGNSYPLCLALVEITKHYIVQKEGRYHSDFTITKRALSVLKKYDLLFAEIVIFYALRSKNYEVIADLLPIFKNHFFDVQVKALGYMSDVLDIRGISFGKDEYVDQRERSILMFFRAATYLSLSKEEAVKSISNHIRESVSRALTESRLRGLNMLSKLNLEQSQDFFSKLEALDYQPPAFMNAPAEWYETLATMGHLCHVERGRGSGNVKIEGQIFGEEVLPSIFLGR
jgi:hypothetical protein